MHHGTLLFDSDLSAVAGALTVSEDKLQSKGVASVRSRVTSIKTYLKGDVTLSEFKSLLLEGIFAGAPMERYDFTPADLAGAAALRDARYATWDWNWGASPAHVIHKRRRVEGCGTVEVFMDVDRGRITALDFRGDYFGADEAGALAGRLVGCPPEEGALRAALAGAEVGQYFTGLTAEHLIEILTQ